MATHNAVTLKGLLFFHSETGTEGGYWAFQDATYITPGRWSYEGLHILKNGDQLVIYARDNPTHIVWSGTIALHPYEPFTQSAFRFWIHADQEGVPRETWALYFFEEYPAELTLARRP